MLCPLAGAGCLIRLADVLSCSTKSKNGWSKLELRELKILFDSGALKEAHICRLFDAWTLECTRPGLDPVSMTTAKSKDVRRFKSLDAAWRTAEEIGFRRATVKSGAAG